MPGQERKPGSPDYTLMSAVFKHHPRAEEKAKGMIGLRVDKHPQYPESTCFMVEEKFTKLFAKPRDAKRN